MKIKDILNIVIRARSITYTTILTELLLEFKIESCDFIEDEIDKKYKIVVKTHIEDTSDCEWSSSVDSLWIDNTPIILLLSNGDRYNINQYFILNKTKFEELINYAYDLYYNLNRPKIVDDETSLEEDFIYE